MESASPNFRAGAPVLLRPDNFTPPSRTPWGGTRLLAQHKAALGITSVDPKAPVGESWELSVSEEFHSLTESGERLGALLAENPRAYLGDEASLGRSSTALLVKWLDAADDLSLQIHPEDDYAGLAADESGKLEAWYVVDRAPGAGIFFGFQPGISEREVRAALEAGAELGERMAFVPVERGDFMLVEPGTPHAIGKGVTLLEPQVGVPGRRAVTYRYWDFGRRYDREGRRDPHGELRALHVRDALAVTRWERASDPEWLASRRVASGWPELTAQARSEVLCAEAGVAQLRSDRLRVARVFGTGATRLPAWNALRSLTVIEGRASIALEGGRPLTVPGGCTAALPAASGPLELRLERAHALVACVAPPPMG